MQIIKGDYTSDGAGVQLKRIIGGRELNQLDPFLLLDEFSSDDPDDYIGGFPSHPHRGFCTLTYMKQGIWRHKDSTGNSGVLSPGGVQWMVAGRGIIHSEMPERKDGFVGGFQLWVNLPKEKKMIPPVYKDCPAETIPEVEDDAFKVRVISGEYAGITGPVKPLTPILYLDLEIYPNQHFEFIIPKDWNGFIYCTENEISLSGRGELLHKGEMAVLRQSGDLMISTNKKGSSCLLVSGEPLNEPVARGGPFVMNTKEEVLQAFADYQNGTLLF